MPLYTSAREKKFWLWSMAVIVTILSTLFLGQPLAELLADQNVRAVFFVIGMGLVGAAIIVHALKRKPPKLQIVLLLGIAAVYVMFFLRLGMSERSHLMEYSILAIFIHKAISERASNGKPIRYPAAVSIVLAFIVGVLDESLQIFLPNRVFDTEDIVFNGLAIVLAIGFGVFYSWVKKKLNKN